MTSYGLIFLHECVHAYDHLRTKRPAAKWRSEQHARRLEARLLLRWYARLNPYVATHPADALLAECVASEGAFGLWEPGRDLLPDEQLDHLFEPAMSRAERTYRRSALGRTLAQDYLERHEAPTSAQRRAVTSPHRATSGRMSRQT